METLAKSAGTAAVCLCLVLPGASVALRSADASGRGDRAASAAGGPEVAGKPRFSVTRAAIEKGSLVVIGTTRRPRQNVQLDGRYATRSGADRIFSFEKAY